MEFDFNSKLESSFPEVFLEKGVLKICSKFTGEHPCRMFFYLQSNFIEITLRHGCSPVNFRHIFRTPFTKTTSGRLLLYSHWLNTINLLIHIILQLNLEISSFFLLVTQLFKQRISKLVLFLSMS